MGFPEKDLHAMECNFLSRPLLESQDVCQQIAPSNEIEHEKPEEDQRADEEQQDKEIKEDIGGVLSSSLKVKLPEVREEMVFEEEEEEDGWRTPTSMDHKIPLVCPPAPRKPKSFPSAKRKSSRKRVLLDSSSEIESLFPPALLADLGNKMKKVRKESIIL